MIRQSSDNAVIASDLDRPLRVLHIGAGNLFGGVERLLVTLAAERHHCPVMSPSFAIFFEGRLKDELTAAGCPPCVLGSTRVSRPWTVWRSRRRLRALLRERKFDIAVVHGAWQHYLIAKVLREADLPVVFWAHMPLGDGSWQERSLYRIKPDFILANSHFTSATIQSTFPTVNVATIYLPVAPLRASRSREAVRKSLSTSDEDVVILFAARLERWKGPHLLLEALAELQSESGWKCWIAGGPQRGSEERFLSELRELADRRRIGDRVQFLGQRQDVADLMGAADIFCQPNVAPEPFGIVFIEAMYAGLTTVTTDLGGAREIFQTGNTGILCPPGDIHALADTLRELIQSKESRAKIANKAPSRAASLCDVAQQLRQVADLLRTVGARKPMRVN